MEEVFDVFLGLYFAKRENHICLLKWKDIETNKLI